MSKPLWALVICWPIAAVMVLGAFGYALLPGSINGESLYDAVQLETPYEEFETNEQRCEAVKQDVWRCGVATDGSGEVAGYYRVTTEGSDWNASRLGSSESDFANSVPESMSSYVARGESEEFPSTAVILLFCLTWLALVLAPLLVWVTARFHKNWSDEPPPSPGPNRTIDPTRPVNETPEKPAS